MSNIQWFDTWSRANDSKCTFSFFIGGRGIGKTYNTLNGHLNDFPDKCGKLIYMRLSGAELDAAGTDEENPYKRLNHDTGSNIEFLPIKKAYTIAQVERDEDGKIVDSIPIGVGRSLASFHNLRGVDFYDYTHIYVDEFNPVEATRKTPELKRAGYLFANAYETINRNRELLGEPPVKVIMTANAFTLDSSILNYFGLIKVIQHMIAKQQFRYTDKERSIYVELCRSNSVSMAKSNTALYKAVKDDKFTNMALNNEFGDYGLSLVKAVKINEYYPCISVKLNSVEYVTIYKHKHTGELYAANRLDTCKEQYNLLSAGKFAKRYRPVIMAGVLERTMYFDSVDTYYKIMDYMTKIV